MHEQDDECFLEEYFSKGEFIFKEGDWGNKIYEIQSGEVLIYKDGCSGNLVPLSTLGAGEMFGEMFLFNPNHRRNATAVAVSDLVVKLYPQADFVKDLESLNPRQQKLVQAMNKKIVRITEHYIEQITKLLHENNQMKEEQEQALNTEALTEVLAEKEAVNEEEIEQPPSFQQFKDKSRTSIKNIPKKNRLNRAQKENKPKTKVQVSHDRVRRKLD